MTPINNTTDSKTKDQRIPVIRGFLDAPFDGEEIEARSFAVIDREAPAHAFSPDEWEVVRRMIHTVGDFSIIPDVCFSPTAIAAARAALRRGSRIYCDSNMIRSGLSLARLCRVNPDYGPEKIVCYVADEGVARDSKKMGLPRSLLGIRKAGALLEDAIVVFGNAPIALLELDRMMMEEGLKPALVIGMPVGFVHVVESKQELLSLPVPFIALAGRRGGSPLAVSVVHALCTLALKEAGEE